MWRKKLVKTEVTMRLSFMCFIRGLKEQRQSMRKKADKYKARQDTILVHAVMRVWLSKERGLLLERAINTRRTHDAWMAWKARIQDLRILQSESKCFLSMVTSFTCLPNRQGSGIRRPKECYYSSFFDDPLEADTP